MLTNDEASISGFIPNESAIVMAIGTITDVGSTPNTYSIDWVYAKENNYTIEEELGTLTVTAP